MFRLFSLAAFVICIAMLGVTEEPPAFLPIGNRYDDVPQEAGDVVKSLKKLQVRTEIRVNFPDYDRAVSYIYPDVKVFVQSAEAREMPELRLVLTNAMDCYLKVCELSSIKLSTDDVVKKFCFSNQLITAQPVFPASGGN